jgi:DMSO/TMAO reductase YedYZ molybdopterin-dependent catalytic subunit
MPDTTRGKPPLTGDLAEQQMRRLTRRSFMVGGAAAAAGIGAWTWLQLTATEDGVPWPLRRVLGFNQGVVESFGAPRHLAPTFPPESVTGPPRINGPIGLDSKVVAAGWQLTVQHQGRAFSQSIRLSEVLALPRIDLVTEFKCVEGWSQVMHFGGVRFADFVTKFRLGTRSGQPPDLARNPSDLFRTVYLATPDEGYYVGLDMASALHPQTLLCDTMNWEPLSLEHGAPLRIYLPVKYGYKSLKRVGLIRFQDERPADYWVERGYDWYGGL